jgi:hypothetical protein
MAITPVDDDPVRRIADIATNIAMKIIMQELPNIRAEVISTVRKELSGDIAYKTAKTEIIKGDK